MDTSRRVKKFLWTMGQISTMIGKGGVKEGMQGRITGGCGGSDSSEVCVTQLHSLFKLKSWPLYRWDWIGSTDQEGCSMQCVQYSRSLSSHMPTYNNPTKLPGPHAPCKSFFCHGGCSTRQYRRVNTYWDVTCVRVLILCVCVANN